MTPQEAVGLLRECDEAMTTGEWLEDIECEEGKVIWVKGNIFVLELGEDGAVRVGDVKAICAIRNALPALRAVIEDQQREVERLRGTLSEVASESETCPVCDDWCQRLEKHHDDCPLREFES